VPVRMEEIREDRERSGANRGKLRAGEEVNSKLQWCEGCKRWVAEKKLGIEETQQTRCLVGLRRRKRETVQRWSRRERGGGNSSSGTTKNAECQPGSSGWNKGL
jgi:hypothetical protein